MGELIGWVVEGVGIYVVYALGKYSILLLSFGTYTVEPYDKNYVNVGGQAKEGKIVSKRITMILGFLILTSTVVILAFKAAPLAM